MQDSDSLPATSPLHHPLESGSIRSHRILVVEDDGMLRRLNAELLLRSGYAVETAEDGADAWDKLARDGFDLMITDHNMPKVSGVELMIRLHGARMALPVILATGAYPHAELARHPWLQPSATLLKPYTAETMLHTVKELLCRVPLERDGTDALPRWRGGELSDGLQL